MEYKNPTFTSNKQKFSFLNAGCQEYMGWCNEATFCFNHYFMEKRQHRDVFARMYKQGSLTYQAAELYMARSGIKIDNWCDGVVYVPAIVDAFVAEQKNVLVK